MARTPKDGSKLEKPRSQVVAEQLAKNTDPPADLVTSQNMADSGVYKDGFVGVDPIYQNNANEFDAPLASEGGVEKDAEEFFEQSLKNEPTEAGEKLSSVYGDVNRGYGSGVRQSDDSSSDDSSSDDSSSDDVQFPGENSQGNTATKPQA
jgi:hypothetical protein